MQLSFTLILWTFYQVADIKLKTSLKSLILKTIFLKLNYKLLFSHIQVQILLLLVKGFWFIKS
jgi:hypothetical protein